LIGKVGAYIVRDGGFLMHKRFLVVVAALASVPVAFAQAVSAPSDAFQVKYASNLNVADSVINITNAGTNGGTAPTGDICVNVYTFAPDQQLIACCACLVTPDGLNSLSARSDLISNPLTPAIPTSIVVKLLASQPVGGTCDASSPTASSLVGGMRAWGTTVHPITSTTYQITETEFSPATLSASELSHITSTCGFIEADGSHFGICGSCSTGGLAASKS
jgi:hypothetical protein